MTRYLCECVVGQTQFAYAFPLRQAADDAQCNKSFLKAKKFHRGDAKNAKEILNSWCYIRRNFMPAFGFRALVWLLGHGNS